MTRITPGAADTGQVAPLVALLLGITAGTALLVAHFGLVADRQARAQAAADAAALAAVLDGVDAASALAAANGARLEGVDQAAGEATVSVTIGGRAATARAELLTRPEHVGLAPEMIDAILKAERLLGEAVPIVSGFRSRAEQQALWDTRHTNPYPVARPGSSLHEQGLAIDVAREFVARLTAVSARVGLCQPLPTTDPVHFEVCRTTATR